ncbi:hypothetical protein [Clostridium prolinivorans]|uniref:hypothetical protein n=1 Tax=Clostridium prolinivorans TaxID=2769420 RepID=UPI000FD8D86F|nr:hypothetical protein [Clostridium prolinivorans]
MNKLSKIAVALTLVMSTSVFAGCSNKKSSNENAQNSTNAVNKIDPTKISGTVNFAVYNSRW